MDLLFLVSTRLDLLRASRLASVLPGHRVRLACYLRQRASFGMPDLEALGIAEVVSWLVPSKSSPAGLATEAMAWADECLTAGRPDLVLLGEVTEASLPLAITAQKAGVSLVCLEAGMPGNPALHRDRVVMERLASFRFCPLAAAAAALQEQGLECHAMGDLLAESHLLLPQGAIERVLTPLGLRRGKYAVLALDAAEASLVTSSGLPTIRVPGGEGGAPQGPVPVMETDGIEQWLAILAGAGCVVSDNLGICRLGAGAGTGSVLCSSSPRSWCEEIAVVSTQGDPSHAVLQAATRGRAPCQGAGGAAIGRMLTEGA